MDLRGLAPDNTREFHDETMPNESGKVARFCSMKISQEGVDEQAALAKGMEQKAMEFVKRGSQLHRKA